MILLGKKILLIEKLNLIWNKQTNFKKPGPLPRVFQILLRGGGMGNLPGVVIFYWVAGIWQRVILDT